ncbi:hypothetical protein FRC07_003013, partial [Ceratobasidium sp. 392]
MPTPSTSSGVSRTPKAPTAVVFEHHSSDQKGQSVNIQRKRRPNAANRYIVPQKPPANNAPKTAVTLPTGVEIDDGLFYDFDDGAGEEIPAPDEPASTSSEKMTPNRQLKTWLSEYLHSYLLALYSRESAPGAHQGCSGCDNANPAEFRCDTCPEVFTLCQDCLLARHRFFPLHRVSQFKEGCWQATSLKELGLEWCLGHSGQPCKASKGTSSILVGDVSGYLHVNIRYCAHTGAPSRPIQLLRAGLFPCTDLEPQSAFTLAMLKHFTLFSTLAKTSAHRYNSVLKRLTNTGFPADVADRYREMLLTQRKFIFLVSLIRCAELFQPLVDSVSIPRSLAIHCPACPRIGVNFRPEDVPEAERPYFRFFISHDGNFRNPRKAKKVDADDVCLTNGRMYFVEQAPYKAWIASKKGDKGKKRARPECDNHKAAVDKFAKWGGLEVTGVGAYGEGCERAWAYLNETAGSTSEKSPGARWDSINYIVGDWNYEKMITMVLFIVGKFEEAKRMYAQQLGVFEELNESLPPITTGTWQKESIKP